MAIFLQIKKIDDCACWVHILGVRRGGNEVPYHTSMLHKYYWITPHKTKLMIFWKFSKFLPQNPKGKWPYGPFSGFRTFLGMTIVLGVLERRLYHHFWLQTSLDTFRGCRRALHDLRTPGTSVSIGTRKWPFCSIFFQARVPHGCTYFSAGCAPQKGRRGPSCVPKQVWTSYDTPIPRFCILKSEKFLHFYPSPRNKTGVSFKG